MEGLRDCFYFLTENKERNGDTELGKISGFEN